MKHRVITYVAALTVSGLGLTAFGQSGQSSGQSPQQPSQQQSQRQQESGQNTARQQQGETATSGQQSGTSSSNRQQSPEGYVLIEEKTVYLMANEPQQHFLEAHAKLAQKDNRAAAEETRLAAAYLDMQAARDRISSGQNQQEGQNQAQNQNRAESQNQSNGQQSLTQQADQLRQLASQIEQGGQNAPVTQLDKDFAQASKALAKHFDSLAKSDLQQKNYVAAGYDLDAAASSFKNTIVWSDQKPSQEDVTMIGNAQQVAMNLRNNNVYAGQQALHHEQQAWHHQGSDQAAAGSHEQGQQATGQQAAGQEQQASQHEQGVTHNPLTGTTPAEAKNDAQHATKLADALGQAIDKFDVSTGGNQGGQAASPENAGQSGLHQNRSDTDRNQSGQNGGASQQNGQSR